MFLSRNAIGRHADWLQFNHFEATVREALEKLNDLVDESDPDIDLPNIVHAFQAAERAREEFPDLDWLHLTALIHDLGKVMAFYGEPQWAVVGDTFPVGCLWSKNIVYRADSFEGNPDGDNSNYKYMIIFFKFVRYKRHIHKKTFVFSIYIARKMECTNQNVVSQT